MMGHVKNYYLFCIFYNFSPLPISATVLCLFATFLARSYKSPDSVRNNLTSLKSVCVIMDYNVKQFDDIQVKLTIRGIKRSKQHVRKKAAPITPQILLKLFEIFDLSDPVESTYWCAFLFSFFAMARKSNIMYTASSTAVNRPILRKDCQLTSNGLILSFRWSKTNQNSSRIHKVPLVPIPNSPLCPVTSFSNMKKLVPASAESPAFVLKSGEKLLPMVYHKYQKFLRLKLKQIGLPYKDYSSHSFRRGGATYAFQCAVPGELIQQHGDWASAAYLSYLDFSMKQKMLVSSRLANSVLQLL